MQKNANHTYLISIRSGTHVFYHCADINISGRNCNFKSLQYFFLYCIFQRVF